MEKKKDVVFYSLIPPLGIEYAVLSFLAPAVLPILIGNILINTVYLFLIALLVLFFTKNSARLLHLHPTFTPEGCISFTHRSF